MYTCIWAICLAVNKCKHCTRYRLSWSALGPAGTAAASSCGPNCATCCAAWRSSRAPSAQRPPRRELCPVPQVNSSDRRGRADVAFSSAVLYTCCSRCASCQSAVSLLCFRKCLQGRLSKVLETWTELTTLQHVLHSVAAGVQRVFVVSSFCY